MGQEWDAAAKDEAAGEEMTVGPTHPFLEDGRPTFGSLFAGIGGFDLGLERAGWRCKWQVEIDEFRTKILERHWPGVPRWRDVRGFLPSENPAGGEPPGPVHGGLSVDLKRRDVRDFPPQGGEPNLPRQDERGLGIERANEADTGESRERQELRVDLICGGFPCQDLSVAGKRGGLCAERSGLFFEFARVAGILQPRWLLVENVPGLLSSREGQDMGIVLETLSELGYGLAWTVLDSQYFGVPQRRRRVFIVGHLGTPCPPEVLFKQEGGGGNTEAGGEEGEGTAGDPSICIEDVGGKRSGGREVGIGVRRGQSYALNAHPGPNRRIDAESETLIAQPLRSNRWGGSDSHGDEGNIVAFREDTKVTTSRRTATLGVGGSGHPFVAAPITAGYKKGAGVNDGRKGSPQNSVCAPPDPDRMRETTGVSGGLDPCSRCPDGRRYAALGDAVTVSVVEWIGRRLLGAHFAV